jgi:beta-galactosidase
MKKIVMMMAAIASVLGAWAQQTSVMGLFPLEGSGRVVYNFNEGWRFLLGDAEGAEATSFDDKAWPVVCAPHTVQLVPAEASGGRNYQGVCWYRKHFTVPADMQGKNIIVHFEAIMGKQWVYVNGRLVKEHEGGYLPITIDLTQEDVQAGDKCLIAVKADNSDDKSYPPGKKQSQLDFAYHGGMYRDVWLVGRSPVHITDPLERGEVAGGGVFLHYDHISEKSAEVFIDVESLTPGPSPKERGVYGSVTLIATIKDADGKVVKTLKQKIALDENKYKTTRFHTTIKNPHLWSPEDPYLYTVELRLSGKTNLSSHFSALNDGGIVRMGIRKTEFRGKDGFWLNGKPYHQLVGGNRHQDFAYVGNALPNSQQWRDAKRLRDVGYTIIRAAHYPQDPSFMDACDELGLFVIVPTPGWQYWNKADGWAEKVHENTRLIIRRDRNHPSVLMWEPILNETRYPKDFALEALQITRDEFPWPGRPVAAADLNSEGVKENYEVLYDWADNIAPSSPHEGGTIVSLSDSETNYSSPSGEAGRGASPVIFTREWGEYVDDWYAHNNINRAARAWGEHAQLAQALSLVNTYGMMFHGQRQFIGGCQWHPFDHQRGYHPDAYFGGLYDAFRQKKYAAEAIRLQAQPNLQSSMFNVQYSLFIAHEMTQSSPADVTIFSNCDSVRLTALDGFAAETLPVIHDPEGVPNAPVVFKGFWDFWQARSLSYTQRNWQAVKLVAEGIVNGQVVCREEKMPARRSTKLRLYADEMGKKLVADGSDFIVVVAEVTDDLGHVRRQAREHVTFTVEGEGTIIGDASIMANPREVEWGSAPVLIRSTHKAGKIRIIANPTFPGVHAPTPDTLVIESIPATLPQCFSEQPTPPELRSHSSLKVPDSPSGPKISEGQRRRELEEVERQQQDFGIQ